ncbi:MAG: hypothetical protein NDI90_20590 [Nitrospira sp. BO4]|jgi:hypothetical protein|nr:hypothetical protein [Nitrospira sp. BO4]
MTAEEVARRLEAELTIGTIELAETIPQRVTPGIHTAVVLNVRVVEYKQYKRCGLKYQFRLAEIGQDNGVILPGYVNLGSLGGDGRSRRFKPSAGSKLARWWRVIADHTGGHRKRVMLSEFQNFLFEVVVINVATDSRQRDIPEAARGQAVSEIASIVQRLGEPSPLPKGYPRFIDGFGPLRADGTDRCEHCQELTPFSYGGRRLCLTHAHQQSGGER